MNDENENGFTAYETLQKQPLYSVNKFHRNPIGSDNFLCFLTGKTESRKSSDPTSVIIPSEFCPKESNIFQ